MIAVSKVSLIEIGSEEFELRFGGGCQEFR